MVHGLDTPMDFPVVRWFSPQLKLQILWGEPSEFSEISESYEMVRWFDSLNPLEILFFHSDVKVYQRVPEQYMS